MEETGTTIHSRLTRRNNFLRENPQCGYFVARELTNRHQGFTEGQKRARSRQTPTSMTAQDPARHGRYVRLQWGHPDRHFEES